MAFVTLEETKRYARIDGSEEDGLVANLIAAAEAYLENTGIVPGMAPGALYRLAVCGIVLHWYDNRAAADTSAPTDFEPGLRNVINQLKTTCQVNASLDFGVSGF